ncbi:helix-turn-helix transcriptional regulator [Rhizobium sp. KVB221]|uniref:Helix-turn-helix transcriptional regulator n=1 Tax=Rhizobium setariae TaxID=2801340 RepID=A0A936YSX1_9HYPH|nr:helix-turn-helix transcriptional regulator [Rhizobium setariae]MBL0372102.1 helix-turn-helix transcriptional regulator [Rhizobium setariae]
MASETNFIDLIYESAFIPTNWEHVLDQMAQAVNGHGTALFNVSTAATRSIASASLEDLSTKMLKEGWATRNTRAQRLLSIEQHGFINEADYFSDEDYETHPIFTEVMKPLGYGFGTSTFISAPCGDKIIFAVEKKKSKGPVDTASIAYLDRLRPHLARAAMMSSRLEFERINAAVEALHLTGLPSAVLGFNGRVLASNRLLENFIPQIVIAAHDQLRFAHAPANDLLSVAIARFQLADGATFSRSFPLPQLDDAPPAVVHLVQVSGNARDIFTSAAFFLVVTPIDRTKVPDTETIQGLFDLSPAEARVARRLAAGSNVAATATQLSISDETVRSHVKSILSKSGMQRQADFIAAIASIRPMGG